MCKLCEELRRLYTSLIPVNPNKNNFGREKKRKTNVLSDGILRHNIYWTNATGLLVKVIMSQELKGYRISLPFVSAAPQIAQK